MYLILKHVHLTFVALSFLAFFIRGLWMFFDSPMLGKKWVKILPHIISTIMLISGIVLAVNLGLSPGSQPWLVAKIVGLIAFVGLGVVTFKHSNPTVRKSLFFVALVLFAYIVSVALTKNPVGFFQ